MHAFLRQLQSPLRCCADNACPGIGCPQAHAFCQAFCCTPALFHQPAQSRTVSVRPVAFLSVKEAFTSKPPPWDQDLDKYRWWCNSRGHVVTLLENVRYRLQGATVEERPEWNQYISGMPDEQLGQLGLTRAQLELTRFCKDNIQDADGRDTIIEFTPQQMERVVLNFTPDFQALWKFLYGRPPGARDQQEPLPTPAFPDIEDLWGPSAETPIPWLGCLTAAVPQPYRRSADGLFDTERRLWFSTHLWVELLLDEARRKIQGHYVEVGRTEDWNAYLDRMPDQKLQQLGLSRQQVELTRYGKDHVQSVPSEEHSPQLPVRTIAHAVLHWDPDYQALFRFVYGKEPGVVVKAPRGVRHHVTA